MWGTLDSLDGQLVNARFIPTGVGNTVFASVSMAHAALPVAATTAFTDLKTDALALVDLAWTAAIPITIAFIILGMFRRAASSAT